jgi:hypothetical protein
VTGQDLTAACFQGIPLGQTVTGATVAAVWEAEDEKKNLTGGLRLDQEPSPGREPEDDLAAGLPSVEVSLGEEDPDTGPDTVLAVNRTQTIDNLADVAALLVRDRPEDIEMDGRWLEHVRRCKGDCFHSGFFHDVSW